MLETAGLTNIVGRHPRRPGRPLGWEAIVDADPDVIVLSTPTGTPPQSKIDLLQSNPATAQLDAPCRTTATSILPFAASEAGVRTVSAAASVAEQLRELDLP